MSSDSDDDCYGNIARKLQSIKSNYKDDKIKPTDLLEDSLVSVNGNSTIEDLTKDDDLPVLKLLKEKYDIDDSPDVPLESIIGDHCKRKTRTRTSNSKIEEEDDVYIPDEPVRPKKRKPSKRIAAHEKRTRLLSGQQTTAHNSASPVTSVRLARGRGGSRARGRGRRRGGRYWGNNSRSPYYNGVIYGIGNTDEYPDMSEEQDLFTTKPDQIIILDDGELNDSLDANEELSVKVYWQSSEFFKFPIRRFQKLTQIYDYFAKKENVARGKLLFTYDDKIVNVDDSPDTINYNIGKFIDGGIVNQSLSPLKNKTNQVVKNGIKLKFQCQNSKRPFETAVDPNDKLSLTLMKCAEHFEKPLEKLKFYFDGDLITGKNTPKDLDLEGGECIDVVIIS